MGEMTDAQIEAIFREHFPRTRICASFRNFARDIESKGRLRIAIEEALESLEAGMAQGAADTLREALAYNPSPCGVRSRRTP